MADEPTRSVTDDTSDEIASRDANQAAEHIERVKEGVSDLAEEGRERFADLEQSVNEYVADNPIRSVLISAGVGLLIGRFLLR